MKHKREQHDELIKRRIDGQQQELTEKMQTEADDEALSQAIAEEDEENENENDGVVETSKRSSAAEHNSVKKRKREPETFRDEEYFIPMFQQGRAKEDAYATHRLSIYLFIYLYTKRLMCCEYIL
jgi:gamma-glutamylcysteine synthetase